MDSVVFSGVQGYFHCACIVQTISRTYGKKKKQLYGGGRIIMNFRAASICSFCSFSENVFFFSLWFLLIICYIISTKYHYLYLNYNKKANIHF